nr:hypothetical protein G8766_02250 [Lactococcus garvieae]
MKNAKGFDFIITEDGADVFARFS